MARLELTLLGGFQARLGTQPVAVRLKKAQALLAYLAMPAGRTHQRDHLATLLWGDTADTQARNSLRQALFGLRKILERANPACLHQAADALSLRASAVDVDVAAFERLAVAGTNEALVSAAALYRGDLLQGLAVREGPFEEWLVAERERLCRLAIAGLSTLLSRQFEAGATEAAITTGLRLVAVDPLHEHAHRTLMRLYAEHGERPRALAQYRACARILQRELRAEPEPETKWLYQEIVRRSIVSEFPAELARPRPTPFIGRQTELAALQARVAEATVGRGGVVALVGEAGIGKTRLLEELSARVDGSCLVLRGHAYETARILPLAPWSEALRGALGRVEKFGDLHPAWWIELGRLFPELSRSRPRPSAGDPLRLFEALAQLVTQLASQAPVVFVLEDLHWADDMSLRFLSFLGRRLPQLAVLIIASARREEVDEGVISETLAELRRDHLVGDVMLDALPHPDTAALVRALAPAAVSETALTRLIESAWRMSEGNPFVVAEVIRGVHDVPDVDTDAGPSLPDRVREMILGRLRRLSDPARQLAAAAAVIGREFDFGLAQRSTGLEPHVAARAVEELVRRHVLRDLGERFGFTHDRIREAVYRDLLLPRRRLLHEAVATALETSAGERSDADIAALAVHHRAAQRWDRAVGSLRAAGAQAALRGAYRDAVSLFEDALTALSHLPADRQVTELAIDLRVDLRDWLMPLGELARLHDCLREAEALAAALGDRRRIGLVAGHLAHHFFLSGAPDRALPLAERAAEIAAELNDFTLQVLGNFYLGEAYNGLGEHPRAVEFLSRNARLLEGERAVERFAGPGLVPLQGRSWLALSLAELGRLDEAMTVAEGAHGAADAVGHPFSLAFVKSVVGRLLIARGAVDRAVPLLEHGFELVESRAIVLLRPVLGSALGYAYAVAGRPAEGVALLTKAMDQAAAMGRSGRAMIAARLGEVYLSTGHTDEAMAAAGEALQLARAQHEHGHEAWALRLLGDVCARDGSLEEAARYYGEAMALAAPRQMRPLIAYCRIGRGWVRDQLGDRGQADDELATGARMLQEMGLAGSLSWQAGVRCGEEERE